MVHRCRCSVDGQGNSTIESTETNLTSSALTAEKGRPGRVRGSNEPASLVATAPPIAADREAKLGRSIPLNPSCQPVPSGTEHAKKPEPFQALPHNAAAKKNGVDKHARLKKPAIRQVEVDLLA